MNRAKKSKIKVTERPVFKTILASTLRPPAFIEDEESGEVSYALTYTTKNGKSETIPCTKGIYQDVEKEKLHSNYRTQFKLLVDEETGLISHINLESKKEFLPAGFNESNIEGNTLDIKNIEISLSPDSELKVLRAPAEVAGSTESEILESLQKDADAKSGDYIAGNIELQKYEKETAIKHFS